MTDQPTSSQSAGEPAPRPVSEPISAPAQQRTWEDTMSQLDVYAERPRVALPVAPPGLLAGYMKWWPWVAIVFGTLAILFSLVALVGSTVLAPLFIVFGSPGTGFGLFLGSIISLLSSILEVIGGYLMLQRKATGWWLLAFGLVVSLLGSLIHGAVFSLVILLLIGYVHLQVKPNYR